MPGVAYPISVGPAAEVRQLGAYTQTDTHARRFHRGGWDRNALADCHCAGGAAATDVHKRPLGGMCRSATTSVVLPARRRDSGRILMGAQRYQSPCAGVPRSSRVAAKARTCAPSVRLRDANSSWRFQVGWETCRNCTRSVIRPVRATTRRGNGLAGRHRRTLG